MAILEGGNFLYLNVSCGKLVNKKKHISTFGYVGRLIDIHQEMDEFEGKDISKIRLKMQDDKGEVAIITFSEESWYSQGFFARIAKIDLTKPFTLGCSGSDQNEKVSFCWMKQKGQHNTDPTKGEDVVDADKTYAKPTKGPRGKDNYDALIDATTKTMDAIKSKLDGMTANQVHKESAVVKNSEHGDSFEGLTPPAGEQTDDLPF